MKNKQGIIYVLIIVVVVAALSFILFYKKGNKVAELKPLIDRKGTLAKSAEFTETKNKADELIKVIKVNPKDVESELQLAKIYLEETRVTGNHAYYDPAALDVIDMALKQDSTKLEAICFKSSILLTQHHFEDGLKTVAEAASSKEKGKSYFLVYFPDIDSMGHRHGLGSKEFEKAIDHCMSSLEEFFWQKIQKSNKKIACLVTADHGMTEVDPKTTIYINKELPLLTSMVVKNSRGQLLAPAGSCRDLFLHIQPDKVEEALLMLRNHLKGKAECYKVSELVEKGFFGSKPVSDVFLGRVGNLVILPFENQSVWWHEKGRFEQHFYASHGGLTRKEIESIFLFLSN